MLQKHARCRLVREKDKQKHQRKCAQKRDSYWHYSTQKSIAFRPYLSHARWSTGKESVAGLSWWRAAERKTSEEMDRQHRWVDRVDPVWSCKTVARSRDIEEDCIWPQRLLTKGQKRRHGYRTLKFKPKLQLVGFDIFAIFTVYTTQSNQILCQNET